MSLVKDGDGMKRIEAFLSFVLILSTLLAACSSGGQEESPIDLSGSNLGDTTSSAGQDGGAGSSQPTGPAIDESNGFRAEAVSYIEVMLTWTEDSGAQGYQLDVVFEDDDLFPLATLDPSILSYDHFLAPEASEITYRLTGIGTDSVRTVTVVTPAPIPTSIKVEVTMEMSGFGSSPEDLGGFDPSTFDPSTFDPSTLDLSALMPDGFDPENPDFSQLMPQPVSVTQEVGPAGGEITITGQNGVIYTLSIPPEALTYDVEITLSPVANIEGIPFSGGFLGGVHIEPRELEFEIPALLTFEIPQEQAPPAGSIDIAFGYEGMGEDFHLEPTVRNVEELVAVHHSDSKLASLLAQITTTTSATRVRRAGARGMTRGTAVEIRNHVQTTPPSTGFSRFSDRITASNTQVSDASLQLDFYNTLKKLDLLDKEGNLDVSDLLIAEDLAEKMDGASKTPFNESLELLVDLTHRLLVLYKPGCSSYEEVQAMVAGGRLVESGPGSSFHSGLRQRFLEKYGEEGRQLLEKVAKALRECRFELMIISTMTKDERPLNLGWTILSEVKVTVLIPPVGSTGELHWRSPYGKGVVRLVSHRLKITYDYFHMRQESIYEKCTGKMNTLFGSSIQMHFGMAFRNNQTNAGGIHAFVLTDYITAGQQRGATLTCIDKVDGSKHAAGGSTLSGSGDLWATIFFGVHRNPREIVIFEMAPGLYQFNSNPVNTRDQIVNVPVTDETLFEILHKPK